MPPEGEEGSSGGFFQKYKVVIIVGGIIAALVIGGLVINRPASPSTPASADPTLTLSGVNSDLQWAIGRLNSTETAAAQQGEHLADLEQDVVTIFATLDALPAPTVLPDYTGPIASLEGQVMGLNTTLNSTAQAFNTTTADLQAQIDYLEGLIGRLQPVMVTRIEDTYVDVTILSGGSYSVILTLYGNELVSVTPRYPEVYTIPDQWSYNQTLTAVIKPQGQWATDYVIEIRADGTVDFASAIAGRGQGEGEAPW